MAMHASLACTAACSLIKMFDNVCFPCTCILPVTTATIHPVMSCVSQKSKPEVNVYHLETEENDYFCGLDLIHRRRVEKHA